MEGKGASEYVSTHYFLRLISPKEKFTHQGGSRKRALTAREAADAAEVDDIRQRRHASLERVGQENHRASKLMESQISMPNLFGASENRGVANNE